MKKELMYERDLIFVPFTTKMNSLEQMFYDELMKEVDEFVHLTVQWLQSNEGKEFLSTRKGIRSVLRNHHIKTKKLLNYLRTNYRIGASYAHKSLGKHFIELDYEDYESVRNLYNGVNDVLDRFEDTITEDILFILNELWEVISDLSYWANFKDRHYTTPISARTRCEMIARTEMARSFNGGVLQTYAKYGIALVELVNYNDIGICDTCIELIRNNPYTLMEAVSILPVHPNCKCFAVVYLLEDGQIIERVEDPIIIDMFNQNIG